MHHESFRPARWDASRPLPGLVPAQAQAQGDGPRWEMVRGQDPRLGPQKKAAAPGRTRGYFFLGPGLGPLQCMHKSVVHARECCACTRILCMHKKPDICDVVAACLYNISCHYMIILLLLQFYSISILSYHYILTL